MWPRFLSPGPEPAIMFSRGHGAHFSGGHMPTATAPRLQIFLGSGSSVSSPASVPASALDSAGSAPSGLLGELAPAGSCCGGAAELAATGAAELAVMGPAELGTMGPASLPASASSSPPRLASPGTQSRMLMDSPSGHTREVTNWSCRLHSPSSSLTEMAAGA